MDIILKDIDTWIKILQGIDKLKDKYGSNIIHDAIDFLSAIEKGKLENSPSLQVVNLLVQNGINDILIIKGFLSSIEGTYRFGEDVIKHLCEVKEKYGTKLLAFINHGNQRQIKIATYSTSSKMRLAHFAKDVYPYLQMDFETNGINELTFYNNKPFILDDIDTSNNSNRRVIYVANFKALKTETLPLKEEMDKINIEALRNNLFIALLEHLHVLAEQIDVSLTVDNPNGTYLKADELNLKKYYTVRSDGNLLDNNSNPLTPTSGDYIGTDKIYVKNASFMVIAKNVNGKVESINLIASESYLGEIRKILSTDLKDFLDTITSRDKNKDFTNIMLK